MKAVIMAGGKGSRIAGYLTDIPKPMLTINSKPVLQYVIENLQKSGINKILLVIGYLGHKIKEYFGNGNSMGVSIEYFEEKYPLGTAGALYYLRQRLPSDFLLVYGDLIFNLDFIRLLAYHHEKQALATLVVHPNNHPFDSDLLLINKESRVTELIPKNRTGNMLYNNCANAGVFVLKREIIEYIEEGKKQDLEKNIITRALNNERVFAYKTSEYIKDIGTPDRFQLVQEHVRRNLIKQRNLSNKQKAIFLDRNGAINFCLREKLKKEEMITALRLLNNSDYLTFIIGHQSVISRNFSDNAEIIHQQLETMLGERGVYIDDIFYCPYLHFSRYSKTDTGYKKVTNGSSSSGEDLIQKAADRYNLDLKQSFLIGTNIVDVRNGNKAGLNTVLLYNSRECADKKSNIRPDFYAFNLKDAIQIIFNTVWLKNSIS